MMENNADVFAQDLAASMELRHKFNRAEWRRRVSPKYGKRSMAPRNIASRKPLPMPENWQGWKNWKPKKKAV